LGLQLAHRNTLEVSAVRFATADELIPHPPPAGAKVRRLSSDLLDQLHLRAVGRGDPAHMPEAPEGLRRAIDAPEFF